MVVWAEQTVTGLISGTGQKERYDIEEAVRRVRSAGGADLTELDDDPGLRPDRTKVSGA